MEYRPRRWNSPISPPFGWYVCPVDPTVIIPEPEKIKALEHAFKQKAKYNTPDRDCCMWLHAATGRLMSQGGFRKAYDKWIGRLKKERKVEISKKARELAKLEQELINSKYFKYTVITDDDDAISSVAQEKLRIRAKKKAKNTKGKGPGRSS